jgi:hypothetical protein
MNPFFLHFRSKQPADLCRQTIRPTTFHPCLIAFFLFTLIAGISLAHPPTTQPSFPTTTTSIPKSQIIAQLDNLFHSTDYKIREQAKYFLMGIHATDLRIVKGWVRENAPLSDDDADLLEPIVKHVYLAYDPYARDPNNSPFLGIHFLYFQDEPHTPSGEFQVLSRIPGFCAYREFQDGDLILQIKPADSEKTKRISTQDQLSSYLLLFRGGDKLIFTVQRMGQVLELPVTLDTRPATIANHSTDPRLFLAMRSSSADHYWEDNFGPFIEPE